jgi:hypothetical protein
MKCGGGRMKRGGGRQQALAEFLDHLADERGKLDTPEDEAEIARYMRLLADLAGEQGDRVFRGSTC